MIWGRRSRKSGDFPPRPRSVGASLPYNPRMMVSVGVEWSAIHMLRVHKIEISIADRGYRSGEAETAKAIAFTAYSLRELQF